MEWHGGDYNRANYWTSIRSEGRPRSGAGDRHHLPGPHRSKQSNYSWRRAFGPKLDQAKRLKDLEREDDRLKRAVSELTLDS